MSPVTIVILSIGFCLRIWLVDTQLFHWVSSKVEFNSPLSSWKRMEEGLYLFRHNMSPYDGDIFHQTPLMLYVMAWLTSHWDKVMTGIFAILDTFTAYLLYRTSGHLVKYLVLEEERRRPAFTEVGLKTHAIDRDLLETAPTYTLLFHCFSPLAIGCCLARSMQVVDNVLLCLLILYTVKGNRLLATLFTALAAYQSLYPAMLIAPVAMVFAERDILGVVRYTRRPARVSIGKTLSLFVFFVCSLVAGSCYVTGGWAYVSSVYGFIYNVPDLNPNMGLFWYLLAEMFEHFRPFFLAVFQVNAFFYVIPLSVRLRRSPMFVLQCLLIIIALFKSYPTYGDLCVYLALLPCWAFTFKYLSNAFLVTNMLIWCGVLAPVMYHLWIYSGSANANFYYFITLVFNTGQVFLLMDIISAYLRREFFLHTQLKEKQDKEVLILQS